MPVGHDPYEIADCRRLTPKERRLMVKREHKRKNPLLYDHYGKLKAPREVARG